MNRYNLTRNQMTSNMKKKGGRGYLVNAFPFTIALWFTMTNKLSWSKPVLILNTTPENHIVD